MEPTTLALFVVAGVVVLGVIGEQNVGKTTLCNALIKCWPDAVERQRTDVLRPQAAYLISTAASGPNAGKYWVRHYDANCGPSYRLPISLVPDFWERYKSGLDIVEHPERDFQEDFDYAFRLEYQPYKQYDGDLFVEFLCEPEELETPEIQQFLAEVSHLRAV